MKRRSSTPTSTKHGKENQQWNQGTKEKIDPPQVSPTASTARAATGARARVLSAPGATSAEASGTLLRIALCEEKVSPSSPERSPKGKGKFSKGKSQGKGKWRPKGSGGYKGSGKGWGSKGYRPRYFTNYENDATYHDYQVRHARQGLSLGDSPPKTAAARATTKYFNISKEPTARSEYFEDLLKLQRSGRPTGPEAEGTVSFGGGHRAGQEV